MIPRYATNVIRFSKAFYKEAQKWNYFYGQGLRIRLYVKTTDEIADAFIVAKVIVTCYKALQFHMQITHDGFQ